MSRLRTNSHRRSTVHTVAFTAIAALLGACAPSTTVVPEDVALPAHDASLAEAGASTWSVISGSLTSVTGCTVRYASYEPNRRTSDVTIVWTHGFLRNLATMRGWAEATASYGVRAVAVSTCASTPIDGRHDANASDLRRVASAVAGEDAPVAYAGFSAGGLASLLAAAGDPRATGLLGLDAVDASNLASAATDLAVPSTFLAGAPHPCNAEGNMLPEARAIDGATVVTIPFATHGDFERPTDPTVDRLCGSLEPRAERERIRTAIRSLAMAWVLDVAGIVHETP